VTHPHDPKFSALRAQAIALHEAWHQISNDPARGPAHPAAMAAAHALDAAQQALAQARRGILDEVDGDVSKSKDGPGPWRLT
jgi:outer membrane protein TolC